MLCDCTATPEDRALDRHDADCIHWTLTTDDPSDHYRH